MRQHTLLPLYRQFRFMRFTRFPFSILAFVCTAPLVAQTPTLAISDLTEGLTATVEVGNCAQGDLIRVVASLTGGGPFGSPFGMVDISPPFLTFPTLNANADGKAFLHVPVPIGSDGIPVWLHAVNASTSSLTNSLAVAIAPFDPIGARVSIPGGAFVMGDHFGIGQSHELPLHNVSVSPFTMDQYETSCDTFAAYLNFAYAAGEIRVLPGRWRAQETGVTPYPPLEREEPTRCLAE